MTSKTKKKDNFVDLTQKLDGKHNKHFQIVAFHPCLPEHCIQKDKYDKILRNEDGSVLEKPYEQEVRIATIGNVDAGKSTTVGVIKLQEPDNGSGLTRKGVFRHQHEIESGRTSDVGNQYIKYKNRLYSISDLAGHEGYLKTTIYGMVSVPIDWTMMVVSANQGIEKMTKEHLGITYALNLNMFVVVTKVDMAPTNVYKENLDIIHKFIKKIGRIPVMIDNISNLQKYYDDITQVGDDGAKLLGVMDMSLNKKYVPIFPISNVSLMNMELLQSFIFNIRPNVDWSTQQEDNPVFVIDKTYSVPGVGLVLSGIVKHGSIKVGNNYMLGPFTSGDKLIDIDKKNKMKGKILDLKSVCYSVYIRNIRDNTDTNISEVKAGFSATLNITVKDKEMVTRDTIQKGMIISNRPISTQKIKAKLTILHHPTKICVGYEPHLHCGGVKETMKIIQMDEEYIQAGKSTNAILVFKNRRCYVEKGDKFIFREGSTRGSGEIIELLD